jgi:hypothetical protein
LRPKTQKELFRILKNPGPGTYRLGDQTAAGSGCSKFKNSSKVKIELDLKPGPKKYDRIPSGQKFTPGPASYDRDGCTSIASQNFKKNFSRSLKGSKN